MGLKVDPLGALKDDVGGPGRSEEKLNVIIISLSRRKLNESRVQK